MRKYKPSKKEILQNRKESVGHAKRYIESLNCGMSKFAKGSNVEIGYLDEKMSSLTAEIKRMQKKMSEGDY